MMTYDDYSFPETADNFDCAICEYLEKCRAGGECECNKIIEVYNLNISKEWEKECEA